MSMKLHVYGTRIQCACMYNPNKCWFHIPKTCFSFWLALNCENLAKQLLPLAMFWNSYRTRLPRRVADSCHMLQSLIIMMLGHVGETHRDGIPVQLMILFNFVIECYKGLID